MNALTKLIFYSFLIVVVVAPIAAYGRILIDLDQRFRATEDGEYLFTELSTLDGELWFKDEIVFDQVQYFAKKEELFQDLERRINSIFQDDVFSIDRETYELKYNQDAGPFKEGRYTQNFLRNLIARPDIIILRSNSNYAGYDKKRKTISSLFGTVSANMMIGDDLAYTKYKISKSRREGNSSVIKIVIPIAPLAIYDWPWKVASWFSSKNDSFYVDFMIYLFHELIHAYHLSTGSFAPESNAQLGVSRNGKYVSWEESQTVGFSEYKIWYHYKYRKLKNRIEFLKLNIKAPNYTENGFRQRWDSLLVKRDEPARYGVRKNYLGKSWPTR